MKVLEVSNGPAAGFAGLLLAELDGKGRSGEDEGLAALVGLAEGLPLCLRIIAQHAVDRPYTSLLDLAPTEHGWPNNKSSTFFGKHLGLSVG